MSPPGRRPCGRPLVPPLAHWSWLRHRGLGAKCWPPAARCSSRHSLVRAPEQRRHLQAPLLRSRTLRRPLGWTTSCSTRAAWTWPRRLNCVSGRSPLPSSTTLPPRPRCSLQPESASATSPSLASRPLTARSCANCRPRRRSWPPSWASSSGSIPAAGSCRGRRLLRPGHLCRAPRGRNDGGSVCAAAKELCRAVRRARAAGRAAVSAGSSHAGRHGREPCPAGSRAPTCRRRLRHARRPQAMLGCPWCRRSASPGNANRRSRPRPSLRRPARTDPRRLLSRPR
jgi:hypothetical protein